MHSLFIFNHWLKFIFFKKKIEILKLQDLLLMLEYALTLENLLDKIKVVSDLTIFDISLSSFVKNYSVRCRVSFTPLYLFDSCSC